MNTKENIRILAKYYKGEKLENVDAEDIKRKYGNQTGSYLEMTDGSVLWVDPEYQRVYWLLK